MSSSTGRTFRLGLTGGIGSGKSTVAHMLAANGAVLVDADAISRQLTGPGGAAIDQIVAQFGGDAVGSDGAMDRDVIRQRVFADPHIRRQLEAILHPMIGLETSRQAALAVAQKQACLVFDVPLLVESGRWRQQLDQVLVVDCQESTQIERVIARNAWTRDAVLAVLANQASRSQRLSAADICIYNDGVSLEALEANVRQFVPRFGL